MSMKAPPPSRDMSARDFLARQRLADHDRRLFENLIEGYYGAPLGEISIASIVEDGSGAIGTDGTAMTRVRGGYGALAHFLLDHVRAKGGHIVYGHVVRRRLCGLGILDRPTAPRSPGKAYTSSV